jgi:hypothetical protein
MEVDRAERADRAGGEQSINTSEVVIQHMQCLSMEILHIDTI